MKSSMQSFLLGVLAIILIAAFVYGLNVIKNKLFKYVAEKNGK